MSIPARIGDVAERAILHAHDDRPTYHPAKLADNGVEPLPWFGSPDLRGLLNADAFILIPPGEVKFDAGTVVDVMRIM